MRSNARTSLLRRAYIRGYRYGLNKARAELRTMAQNWDVQVASLQEKADKQLRSMAASFDAEIDKVRSEMRATRQEFNRYRAVEHAVNTERDSDTLLN